MRRWPLPVVTVFILGLASVLCLLRWGPSVECKRNPTNHLTEKPPSRPPPPSSRGLYQPHQVFNQPNRVFNQPNILSERRTDVVVVTPWLAPIVWDTTFDPVLVDAIYEPRSITMATTVFAIGKYTRFLRDFLETAERHLFVGFKVRYYVFTDRPDEVPSVKMEAGRELFIRPIPGSNRWQEISAGRMKRIQDLIETELRGHVDYIFCFDVDAKFHGRWGTETLGQLVAAIHPGFYTMERKDWTYERRPVSTAYMAPYEGDYYYQAALFGGELTYIHHLVSTCRYNFEVDAQQGIEAAWQDESHFNRYLWLHKPTKVLSPEYLWQDFKTKEPEIRIIRYSSVVKNNSEVRPNA